MPMICAEAAVGTPEDRDQGSENARERLRVGPVRIGLRGAAPPDASAIAKANRRSTRGQRIS